MSDQDNKATLPIWYRKWIIKRYTSKIMNRLDAIGAKHDIEINKLGWSQANKNMCIRMRNRKLPRWTVRLPISLSIGFYSKMPNIIKTLIKKHIL